MWIYIPFVLLHNLFFHLNWLFDDVEYNHRILLPFKGGGETFSHILMQFIFTHREPFSGAMWFVDSLFLGLLGYSLITKLCKLIKWSNLAFSRFIICMLVATISAYFHKLGFDIPKISNTCSAMLLICVGHFMGQRKLEFNNRYVFIVSLIVAFHYNALSIGMALNGNEYPDIVTLVVAPISVIYVLAYVFKKIDTSIVGKTINYVGRESFWVMGLHMIGFHIFSTILEMSGIKFEHHFTTPAIGNNWGLLVGYFFFGVTVPLIIKELANKLNSIIIRKND